MKPPHHGARFCPDCGAPSASEAETWPRRCSRCGAAHHLDPRPCASALAVDHQGRVLLVRRDIEPRRGLWQVPGGFMEAGESPEQAATRELREEALVDIDRLRLLGVYSAVAISLLVIVYEARALGAGAAGHDVQEVGWFTPDKVPWAELSYTSTEQTIRDWLARRGHPAPAAFHTTWGG